MSFSHRVWESSEKLKSISKDYDNFPFNNDTCRLFHERRSITPSFAEHLHFPEKKLLRPDKQCQIKINKQDSGPFGFSKYYKQSLRKEQYWYFFPGEPKISEINKFYKWNAVARYVTFCSLKMLGTGCSSKVAILLLLSKNTKNFKNKLPLDSGFTLRFRTF